MKKIKPSKLANWKARIDAIRDEVKQAVLTDWLEGWSMRDLRQKYDITKVTFYKWIKPTPEMKLQHSVAMWTNRRPKVGRPVGS